MNSDLLRALDCWAISVKSLVSDHRGQGRAFRTIGKVDQVESLGRGRVTDFLQPDLDNAFRVAPIDKK